MSSGSPIISLYSIENDSSKSYLDKYPNSLLINENDNIKANINIIEQFCNMNMRVSFSEIEKIFYENTPEYCSLTLHNQLMEQN